MLDCFVCPNALFVGLTTVFMRDIASTVRPSRALAGQSKSPQIVTTDQSHQTLEVSLCFIKKNTVKSLCRYEVIEEKVQTKFSPGYTKHHHSSGSTMT